MADRKTQGWWVAFGAELRRFREAANMLQRDVAEALNITSTYYSAMETGKRGVDEKYVSRLDEVFNASGQLASKWAELRTQSAYPLRFQELPELEGRANRLYEFQPLVYPGLVQIEEYARAVYADTQPSLGRDALDQLVANRMQRQKILGKHPRPLIMMVIGESALYQRVGGCGPELLAKQCQRLLTDVCAGTVRAQILPRTAQRHYGASGPFRLYTFADQPSVASAEYMTGEVVINDVERYQECATCFGLLQSEALSVDQSIALLRKVADEESSVA